MLRVMERILIHEVIHELVILGAFGAREGARGASVDAGHPT
jgi:hypothetical protein